MSKQEHTPGPWRHLRHHVFDRNGIATASCWPRHVNVSSYTVSRPLSKEEADANARLIASAPSLLKALRNLVRKIEEHNSDTACEEAKAAIAAAEGGE